jgi:hypothetical protein
MAWAIFSRIIYFLPAGLAEFNRPVFQNQTLSVSAGLATPEQSFIDFQFK